MTRPEHLATLIADVAPPVAKEITRTVLKTFNRVEYEEWESIQNAKRQRKFREKQRNGSPEGATVTNLKGRNASDSRIAVTTEGENNGSPEGATVTNHPESNGSDQVSTVTAAPPLPPEPPTPPAPHAASAPAHTRGVPSAPTLAEVTAFLAGGINSVPPDRRAECAQAYIDNRSSVDPAWHKPPTNNRPAVPINLADQGWHGDCRQFSKNWASIEQENGTLRQAKLDRFSKGSGPPGRSSSTYRPPEQRTFDDEDV